MRDIVLHKTRYFARTFCFAQCLHLSTASQEDSNYHTAKKHIVPKTVAAFNCKLCYRGSLDFGRYDNKKNTQHGFPIKSAFFDREDIVNDLVHMNLKRGVSFMSTFLDGFRT